MTDQNKDSESASRRLIRDAWLEAHYARRQLREEQPASSLESKEEFAAALAGLRELLLPFKKEDVFEIPWSDRSVDVDIIEGLVDETVEVPRELNRRGGPTESKTVPLVHTVDEVVLTDIHEELNKMFFELPFTEDTDSGDGEMFNVKRNPEEYNEPVKDNIPKPK